MMSCYVTGYSERVVAFFSQTRIYDEIRTRHTDNITMEIRYRVHAL